MAQKDYTKLLYSMLDRFPTGADTLVFFQKNAAYFTAGGYKVYNFDEYKLKFSARPNDNTPSTLCKPKLTTVDFGDTGTQKGILQFIIDVNNEKDDKEYLRFIPKDNQKTQADRDMNRKTYYFAIQELANLLDVDENKDLDDYVYVPPPKVEEKKAKEYTVRYVDKQRAHSLKNDFNKNKTKELMDELCRSCSLDEKRRAIKIFNIGLLDYMHTDKGSKTPRKVYRLFLPEYSKDLKAYGCFKYNRAESTSGLLRKNCQRVLFGIHLSHVFSPEKPIIFAEGHSDVVVNNSKRIQTITSGSATTPIGENISEMKGKLYHLFYDLDDAGVKGITSRLVEIEMFNKDQVEKDKIRYKVFQWSSKVIIKDEVVEFISYEDIQREHLQRLIGDTRKGITIDENELFEKCRISTWQVLSNEPKKKGFDWIDFHTEMKDHPKYNAFINQYTY